MPSVSEPIQRSGFQLLAKLEFLNLAGAGERKLRANEPLCGPLERGERCTAMSLQF